MELELVPLTAQGRLRLKPAGLDSIKMVLFTGGKENKGYVSFELLFLWELLTTSVVEKEGSLFFQQSLGGICHSGPLKQQDGGEEKAKKQTITFTE